jgi:CRP-like cAMP-binding protein
MQLENLALGDCLLSQGDISQSLYLLVEGKLKISMLSPEGKRLILAFKTPFDLVGDIEYIQQCPLINTVEVVTDSRVIRIPYEVLRKEMENHVPWLQFLLGTITQKFKMKSQAMNFNLFYPVDVRLAYRYSRFDRYQLPPFEPRLAAIRKSRMDHEEARENHCP